MYMATITIIGYARPGFLPAGQARSLGRAAARRCATSGRRCCCLLFVIGGIYGGLFTATEAAGMGAGGAFLIGIVRRRLSRPGHPVARCSRRRARRQPFSPC